MINPNQPIHITIEQPANDQPSTLPRNRNRVAVIEAARAVLAWDMGIDYPAAAILPDTREGVWPVTLRSPEDEDSFCNEEFALYTSQINHGYDLELERRAVMLDRLSQQQTWRPGYSLMPPVLETEEDEILRELIPALGSNVVYSANPARLDPDWCFYEDREFFMSNARPIAESWNCSVDALHFASGIFALGQFYLLKPVFSLVYRQLFFSRASEPRSVSRGVALVCDNAFPRDRIIELDNGDYRTIAPEDWIDRIKKRIPACEEAVRYHTRKKKQGATHE